MGNAQARAQVESMMQSLQSSIASVLTRNSTSINNSVANNQYFKAVMMPTFKNKCCNIQISNKITSTLNNMGTITSSTAVQISSKLQSLLNSQIDQQAEAISQLLGGNADTSTIATVKQRVEQIINNQISTSNLNNIANSVMNNQGLDVVIDGNFECACTGPTQSLVFGNDIQAQLTAQTIVQNMTKAILDDAVINSISQRTTQKSKAKNQGLVDILVLLAILGVLYLLISSKSSPTLKKVMLLLIILLIVYLIYSYVKKTGVFKKKYWGCNVVNGMNQGCKEYDNPTDGPFESKEDCEALSLDGKLYVNCPQYWGCARGSNTTNPNKLCKQLTDAPSDGTKTFGTESECTLAGSGKYGVCGVSYGCPVDEQGFVVEGAKECQAYNNDAAFVPENVVSDKTQCDAAGCSAYHICRTIGDPVDNKKSCDPMTQQAYQSIQCCFEGGCGPNNAACDPQVIQNFQNKLFKSKSACQASCK